VFGQSAASRLTAIFIPHFPFDPGRFGMKFAPTL